MSDEQPISFANRLESGFSSLAGASPAAFNVVVDGKGAVRRRPCLATYDGVQAGVIDSHGIDGVYVTSGGQIYATGTASPTAGHQIYRLTAGGTRTYSGEGSSVRGNGRPTFAETEALLVIAAGDKIIKLNLADSTSGFLGGDPPFATHVAANSQRLLANDLDNRNRFDYSAPASGSSTEGHETWSSLNADAGFISAGAKPDPILALHENINEILVWGTTTLQVFGPDSQSVYAPLSTRAYGLTATYSVVKRDQEFFFLDHKERFIQTDGRTFNEFGQPIQKTINDIPVTTDAFGYWCRVGFLDALCWCFPSDGRTFVFQPDSGWGVWASRSGSNWGRFAVNAHFSIPGTGVDLVGTTDGRVAQLTFDSQTDFGDPVTAYVETGAIDRGTNHLKHCISVRIVLGGSVSSSGVAGCLSWRDDEGSWGVAEEIRFDRDPVVILRSLGTYRRRWWRFEFSTTEAIVLAEVTEEFEVLGV